MVEIDPANSLGGCDWGCRMNWQEVKNMLLAAKDDYSQLFEKDRPIANDVNLLMQKLGKNVPSNADFRNPQAMSQWAQAAALNAPMMGIIGKLPPTKFSRAHDLAQKNAALPIEKGGLGLPPNNTAMDRAKAMGFDTNAYHGTDKTFDKFNPLLADSASKTGVPAGSMVVTSSPETAATYGMDYVGDFTTTYKNGANVMPLLINPGKNLSMNARQGGYTPNWNDIFNSKFPDVTSTNDFARHAKIKNKNSATIKNVKDNARMSSAEGHTTFLFNPSQLRSLFAAFDPMQKDSANILASILLGTSLYGNYGDDQ